MCNRYRQGPVVAQIGGADDDLQTIHVLPQINIVGQLEAEKRARMPEQRL